MLKKINILVAFYGVVNVFVFFLLGVFGGFYDSLHTLLFREVSYSISPYAQTNGNSIAIFLIYNVTLFLFSIFLSVRMQSLYAKLGAISLTFAAIAGFALLAFPMDPPFTQLTIQGVSHNTVAILLSLYTVIAINLFAVSFSEKKNLKYLARYSVYISIIIMIIGLLTGIFAFLNMSLYVGFLEKFAIGSFLLWIFITSVSILNSDKRIKYFG